MVKTRSQTSKGKATKVQCQVDQSVDDLSKLPRRSKRNVVKIVGKSFQVTNEISTQELIVPLICPITKKRLEVPCIGAKCNHLSCFDGKSFRAVNQAKRKTFCPFCHCKIKPDRLKVDSLIEEILSSTSPDCDKVCFDQKGNWRPFSDEKSQQDCEKVSNENIITLDDFGDDEKHSESDGGKDDDPFFVKEVTILTEAEHQTYAEIINLDELVSL